MQSRPHLRIIAIIGLIVPQRVRSDWRQEWETELRYREMLLADWDRLDWRHRLELVRRSLGAFWDALWLQQKRLEADVFQDLRYGVRMLLTHRGFTAVSVVTLALGIGANTAIFSLLDRVLIRRLPVERPGELVMFVSDDRGTAGIYSYPIYTSLRDQNAVLSGLAAYFQGPFSLSHGGATERVIGQVVSGNYFDMLGVRPALGRFFLPEEDRTPGTHPVAVIGHGLWQRRFAADPAIIGTSVTINAYDYTVIGITPAEFTGTTAATVTEVYVPIAMQPRIQPGNGAMFTNPNWGWLRLIGRLKPGLAREPAQTAMADLAAQLTPARPAAPGPKAKGSQKGALLLVDGGRGHTERVRDLSLPLKLLMGVVGFILLIACANVTNLLLARASARRREISVRLAIGATPGRIVRQLLTEGTIIALLGGVSGLIVAYWLTGFLLGFQQQTEFVPRTLSGAIDLRVLGFTAALSLLAGILFALAPARLSSKTDLVATLKSDGHGTAGWTRRFALRDALVVGQIALSMVVLIGAVLFVKSLRSLQAIDPGMEPAKVVTASLSLGLNGYDQPRGRQCVAAVTERVSALPGVEAVSFANIPAFSSMFWISGATIDGYEPQEGERMAFDFNAVAPDYFRTIGTPLVSGREFGAHDNADAPRVIVVNEAAARRYWPGRDPVGRRTNRGEVIGVVRNSREKGMTVDPRPTIYLPLLQNYTPDLTLHVRSAMDSSSVIAAVRREIQAVDSTLPLYNVGTLAEQRDGALYTERLAAALLTLFGALALVLAAVGIYGVLSYAVTERTREMGIRLTQGAQPRDLFTLVVGKGMVLTITGTTIGVAAAFALTRLVQQLLFGVRVTDPWTYALVPLALAVVAFGACWIPARRATRLSALAALRYE